MGKLVAGEDVDTFGIMGGFAGVLVFVSTIPSISPLR